jgi:hypothetical protein
VSAVWWLAAAAISALWMAGSIVIGAALGRVIAARDLQRPSR